MKPAHFKTEKQWKFYIYQCAIQDRESLKSAYINEISGNIIEGFEKSVENLDKEILQMKKEQENLK